jgi:hypothetical protein
MACASFCQRIQGSRLLMLVYAVYRQSDMTEGKGPMVLDRLYQRPVAALEYMNAQPGVMGRSGKKDHTKMVKPAPIGKSCPGWSCKECWPYGGDYQMKGLYVFE